MTSINEIVGLSLLVLGSVTILVCLIAFVKVLFAPQRKHRGAKEVLEQINSLIRSWTQLLKLVPYNFRQIFVLLPFGLILVLLGLHILINKPI